MIFSLQARPAFCILRELRANISQHGPDEIDPDPVRMEKIVLRQQTYGDNLL
jgi:hypothetical protein